MMRLFRILMLGLLLPLGGCGIISIGYNNADVYLRYTVNSYASFDKAQKVAIHDDVERYMAWHRNDMLPEYVQYLRALEQTIRSGGPLQPEEAARYRRQVRELYIKTMQHAIRPAASILVTVSAEQIAELEQSFASENRKLRDKELSGDLQQQLHRRGEKIVDFIENLVGSLSDAQLEKVRTDSYSLPYTAGIMQTAREENQLLLLDMLRRNAGLEEIEKYLSAWLAQPESLRSDEDRVKLTALEQASDGFMVEVYDMLSEKQRKKLLKNLEKYSSVFSELAAKKTNN